MPSSIISNVTKNKDELWKTATLTSFKTINAISFNLPQVCSSVPPFVFAVLFVSSFQVLTCHFYVSLSFVAVHIVCSLTHIVWVSNGTKHNITYLPLSPFHIFTDLSNAALAIRRPSGEKLTWFIKAWWPVIRAKGFLLSSGSHRKRVKSSEPDTNRSLLPPCTKLNKNGLSWLSTIKEELEELSQWVISEMFAVYRKILSY